MKLRKKVGHMAARYTSSSPRSFQRSALAAVGARERGPAVATPEGPC